MIGLQTQAPKHIDQVRKLTSDSVNKKIDHATEQNIQRTLAGGEEAISMRLKELDKEWHIDRVLMLNFSILVSAQLILAATKSRKWLWGPLTQTPFLGMHAVLGWCPPSLWFRPLGFRTRQEIETEREILLTALNQKQLLQ